MMIRRHVLILSLLVALAAPVMAPHASAQGRPLRVLASFSILADIAANVAGETAEVESLMPLGANPHAYEPSAQDVVRLSEADLVLVAGINFEEGLLSVVQEAAGDRVITVSECVPVRRVQVGTVLHDEDAASQAASTPPATGTDALAATCDAHHAAVRDAFGLEQVSPDGETLGPAYTGVCNAGGCDPHVWTDPVNAGLWALMIRDALSARDPAHAETYTANADAYLKALAEISDQVADRLSSIEPEHRTIVTNHLALTYFAARYGLRVAGVVIPGGSTNAEPSVQEMLALMQAIEAYDVPAIFTETTVSEDLARQIADETGAAVAHLYTGSLSQPGDGAHTYLAYTLYNAITIAEALH